MNLKPIEDQLSKLSDKQEKTLEILSGQAQLLARMTAIQEAQAKSLDEHIRRTNLAEERIKRLELHDQHFVSFVKGAAWIIGGLITVGGVILKIIPMVK